MKKHGNGQTYFEQLQKRLSAGEALHLDQSEYLNKTLQQERESANGKK